MSISNYHEDNKRIAKNTIYLTIRLVFMLFIGLYTSRVILDVLGVEDYGTYNVVSGFVSMFIVLSSFFTSSCQRYLSYVIGEGNEEKISEVFSTIQIITTVGCVFLLLVSIPLCGYFIRELLVIPQERLDSAEVVYYCSVATLALTIIAQPYIALVTAYEHINFYSIISICDFVLKLLAVILIKYLPSYFDYLQLYPIFLLIISIANRFAYSIYCHKEFSNVKVVWHIKRKWFREITLFSFWTGFGTVGGVLKDQGGNVVLNNFFGVTLNSARAIALQIQTVLNQIGSSLSTPIAPQITKAYAAGDNKRATSLTLFLGKIQAIVSCVVVLPLLLETKFILKLWLVEPPKYSVEFVQLSLILSIIQIVSNSYAPLFLAIGKIRNLQILAFIINITLVPVLYGLYKLGLPAIAIMYCTISYQIIILIISFGSLKITINFPVLKLLETIIKTTIVFASSYYLCSSFRDYIILTPFVRLFVVTLLSFLIFVTFAYLIVLSTNEKSEIKKYISAYFSKH